MTILFADVSGSTALGEELDPEDVRALLGRYYAIAKDVVPAHGGTLEKFIGDAVMAVFGLARAHGDDPRRALDAALALRDQVRADPRLGEHLPIRVGVNTGEVVASRGGENGDFLVTGDAVNVAARIQQLAEPWAIMCAERTARAAGSAFAFGAPVALEAKGKRKPVSALPVLGRSAARVLPRMPLLGRDDDLAQLELVASRAFKEKRPFLVSLIAPAGTGKSRLLEEFLDRLPGRAPAARVAIAQCLPYGQRLTYWPLRGILYRLAAIADDAEPAAARSRITQWLTELGAEPVRDVARQLAATVGVAETDALDSSQLFGAWRTALELAARREPHVIVFEDLHWSSDSLLDLVEFVMQPRGDTPVLMIALTRPELLDRRPAWGGGRRNHLALSLEPLADDAIAGLVRSLLESARPELIQRVVERSEGNPFYAGELVRSLVERIGPRADEAAIEAAMQSLPDTVQATVLARLDVLAPDERRLVQIAAVFGRGFRTVSLEELEPRLAGRGGEICEALMEKDLIRPSGADGFTFRHILIREVAYQTLPRAERARLHAQAAASLERESAGREETLAELVAYHYRESASLAAAFERPEEGAAVRAKAVHWLRRAADTASAAAAMPEAARHLRAAIELADPSDRADLYLRLGESASSGNESVDAFRTAYELYKEQGAGADRELAALARYLLFNLRSPGAIGARPPRELIEGYRRTATELAERATDRDAVARYWIAEGFYCFWLEPFSKPTEEQTDASEAAGKRGYEIAGELGDARLQSAALDGLAGVAVQRGSWHEAQKWNSERLGLFERLDLMERVDAGAMLTWGHTFLGELDDAARVSAQTLAGIQPVQVPAWTLHVLAWRTYALMLRGDWDEASALGDRMWHLWSEIDRPPTGYAMRGFIAAFDVARQRSDEARAERASEAIRTISLAFPAGDDRSSTARAFVSDDLATLLAAVRAGDYDAISLGQDFVERAYARAGDEAFPVELAPAEKLVKQQRDRDLRLVEAQLRRAIGVGHEDRKELEQALVLFEQTRALPYIARVGCELALLDGDAAAFDESARPLERLGDRRQLRQYEMRRRAG